MELIMASIINESNGHKRIDLVCPDGIRRSIRLGKATTKQAIFFKERVERLNSAAIQGQIPDDETSRWLADLQNIIHQRVAKAGLVKSRGQTHATLKSFYRCIPCGSH